MTAELEDLLSRVTAPGFNKSGWDGFVHYASDRCQCDYIIFDNRMITDKEFIEAYLKRCNKE